MAKERLGQRQHRGMMTEPVTIEVVDEAAARTLDGPGQFTRADFLRKAVVGGGALVAGGIMVSGLPELVEAQARRPPSACRRTRYR